MTTDAPFADEWFHEPFRTRHSRPVPERYRHGIGMRFRYHGDALWMKRHKWATAAQRRARPGPATWSRFDRDRAIRRAIRRAIAEHAKRPPTCNPSEHDWNNDGIDPTHCLRCGMSFTRHIFMECE